MVSLLSGQVPGPKRIVIENRQGIQAVQLFRFQSPSSERESRKLGEMESQSA